MQVSGGFYVPADWSWLVLVGALVGDGLASDNAPWLAIVNRAECSECNKAGHSFRLALMPTAVGQDATGGPTRHGIG
jgi:hypothetical protein